MRRLLTTVIAVSLILATGACSGTDENPNTTRTTAPATAEPTTEPTAEKSPDVFIPNLGEGLVVMTCTQIGATTSTITAYRGDSTGGQYGTTTFSPPGDLSVRGACNSGTSKSAVMYNYSGEHPFTLFFYSSESTSGDYAVIEAVNTVTGEITQLTQPPGTSLDKRPRDYFPVYHGGTGRVYYWDMSGDSPQLMSVLPTGEDPRSENIPGITSPGVLSIGEPDGLYMPDTDQPIAASFTENTAYSSDGTLAAHVGGDHSLYMCGDMPRCNSGGVALSASGGTEPGLYAVAFVPGSTSQVILTDRNRIYQFTGNGELTVVYENPSGKQLNDVTVGPDGSIAFWVRPDYSPQGAEFFMIKPGNSEPQNIGFAPEAVVTQILRLH